jgi:hypothetical protein
MTSTDTEPTPQSNATNSASTVLSDTTCPHGHTVAVQYLRDPSYANAASLKASSFQNHQRILPQCNCTLT